MIKLGLIGISPGNGHPYSWSAIINGYDPEYMADCPFPVIPQYLSAQKYPDAFIKDARVTHVWAQDQEVRDHIAKAGRIEHTVNDYTDMIGKVDAVLLARDDYLNHSHFALPFIQAGIPIYIDKPLANSLSGAQKILGTAQYPHQIYTCSAFRFAPELESLRSRTSAIRAITAETIKSWSLYSIHIIEPVVSLLGIRPFTIQQKHIDGETVDIEGRYGDLDICFRSSGTKEGRLALSVKYDNGTEQTIRFDSPFESFRSALEGFLDIVRNKRNVAIPVAETLHCMSIIEHGKTQDD